MEFICYTFSNVKLMQKFKKRSDVRSFQGSDESMSKRVLDIFECIYLGLRWKVSYSNQVWSERLKLRLCWQFFLKLR